MAHDFAARSAPETALDRILRHFDGIALDALETVEKVFPTTVRPDLETAIQTLLQADAGKSVFVGIGGSSGFETLTFSSLLTDRREPPVIAAASYLDIDIGEATSGRCLVAGVWFFHTDTGPAALLISQVSKYAGSPGVRAEVILSPGAGGRVQGQVILADLTRLLTARSVYRGRALSFETERSYDGGLGDLKVHRMAPLTLDQIILPKPTLDLLDRTVFGFVKARERLLARGFSAKRGLLLYGPPGTGKTHFIRYVIANLPDHTALIVTAEQVAWFDRIMAIARAMQPSIVVIEDADLLARARELRDGDCSQVLLNSLLNHMDGLTDQSEIIFILTTNRPETIEAAIRDRPGRIDQAIEIPRPDADCRARLLRLYGGSMVPDQAIVAECVARTANASAAFMRELARRMAQSAILRDDTVITRGDMHLAFDEMLQAGSFTAKALGADPLV